MLDNAVRILKQRQQAVKEQLKSLQAESGKLGEALRILDTLSGVATEKVQPAKKRKVSAAGHKAIAASRVQWVMGRSQEKAEAKVHLPPERDHRRENIETEKAEQKSETLVPASQRIPCTCGGINTTCMYCAGTGMREPS